MQSLSLWHRVEPLLRFVERPSRYINHEYNAAQSSESADYKVTLLYPDTYEIGQANQALIILYQIIRDLQGCSVERSYLPWVDMMALMREKSIPLFSLESCSPVAAFDLVGITLPHEMAATNILEALDLAGIPLHSTQRGDSDPLVLAGGPGAFNPEPIACFFDAIAIGEGEELIVEVVEMHRQLKAQGANRQQILEALSSIEGIYVPQFYAYDRLSGRLEPQRDCAASAIRKRIVKDLDAVPVPTCPIVPYVDVAHDRLTVEILRGCTRGCRFCQAGMIYRPVRERKADTIINAIANGIACTGFEEVSLTSLSSTDHSQIAEILRRANNLLSGTAVGVSLPSQRLDAFGVEMAQLIAGEKKAGLTFAPEAGTQRLRDIINKNVTESDLLSAVHHAYTAGWRRCKLYFMIGLPGETDEDIQGIANLANAAYLAAKDAVPDEQRGSVRMSVSVAVFVPKPQTPFQWMGQIALSEIQRRIELLKKSKLHKGIDLHWHDPATSLLEAALSRGGRETSQLIEAAWRGGATFDAWTERFNLDIWLDAARNCGVDLQALASRDYDCSGPLPWDHIECGVEKEYLFKEWQNAQAGVTTEDCSFASCTACGVCQDLDVQIALAGDHRG